MNWITFVGGGVSALLLAYLTIALLKPEKFS
jgi:K+-transporting ATPase KdpF subunit